MDGPIATKRIVEVELPEETVVEAETLHVDLAAICQAAITREMARARDRAWAEANRAAIESVNAYIEKHGLPLGQYRQF